MKYDLVTGKTYYSHTVFLSVARMTILSRCKFKDYNDGYDVINNIRFNFPISLCIFVFVFFLWKRTPFASSMSTRKVNILILKLLQWNKEKQKNCRIILKLVLMVLFVLLRYKSLFTYEYTITITYCETSVIHFRFH